MRKPSKVCVNIGKFYLDFWKNMSFWGLPSSWSKRSTGFFFNESIPKIHQRIFFSCARRPKTSGAVATVPKLPVIEVFSASMPNHRSPREWQSKWGGLKWCQSNCQIGKVLGPGFFSGGKCVIFSKHECRYIYIYTYVYMWYKYWLFFRFRYITTWISTYIWIDIFNQRLVGDYNVCLL